MHNKILVSLASLHPTIPFPGVGVIFWIPQLYKETRTVRSDDVPGSTCMLLSAHSLTGKLMAQTQQVSEELALASLLQWWYGLTCLLSSLWNLLALTVFSPIIIPNCPNLSALNCNLQPWTVIMAIYLYKAYIKALILNFYFSPHGKSSSYLQLFEGLSVELMLSVLKCARTVLNEVPQPASNIPEQWPWS